MTSKSSNIPNDRVALANDIVRVSAGDNVAGTLPSTTSKQRLFTPPDSFQLGFSRTSSPSSPTISTHIRLKSAAMCTVLPALGAVHLQAFVHPARPQVWHECMQCKQRTAEMWLRLLAVHQLYWSARHLELLNKADQHKQSRHSMAATPLGCCLLCNGTW